MLDNATHHQPLSYLPPTMWGLDTEPLLKTFLLITHLAMFIKSTFPPNFTDKKEDELPKESMRQSCTAPIFLYGTHPFAVAVVATQLWFIWARPGVYPQLSEVNEWVWIGYGLTVVAWLFRMWCFRTLGRFFTFQVAIRKGHHLVQSGPYRYLVHPSYLGLIVLQAGNALFGFNSTGVMSLALPTVLRSPIGFVIMVALAIRQTVQRTGFEEKVMREKFGEEWDKHVKARWRLLPFVY